VLELGDAFRMAGPIMPTLPSKVEYTVIAPDGTLQEFAGVANAVGYYYQPADDFILNQTGEWIVELKVYHDGMTSAGPVEEPFPTGGPLTPDLHTFSFFVVESAKERLPVQTDLAGLDYQPWHYDVNSATFAMSLLPGFEPDKIRMVATIPGIVLASEELPVEYGHVEWRLDGTALNRLVHNLDHLQGLADTITVTFFAEDGDQVFAGSLVVHGWHVPLHPNALSAPSVLPTPIPGAIVITSIADSGSGTLRQALLEAESGDVITFDPSIFPPDTPVTLLLSSSLPELNQGNITIDASNAGVILDGSKITTPELVHGIVISSDNNAIRGLQIIGFSDAGIALINGAQYNVIGGDWNAGDRRTGQSNLISANGNFGIGLWGEDTSFNTIEGNMIGITWNGAETWGHDRDGIHSNGATHNMITGNIIGGSGNAGVYLCCAAEGGNVVTENQIGAGFGRIPLANGSGIIIDRTSHNVVGPANLIGFNDGDGISFWEDTPFNIVTQNRIWDNAGPGIVITSPSQIMPQPPRLLNFDLQAGTVSGVACANCSVEIFSDNDAEGAIYEGQTEADESGAFTFMKGAPLTGPFLTATATDPNGNTSEFSQPVQ
jgi:hypothetical protein